MVSNADVVSALQRVARTHGDGAARAQRRRRAPLTGMTAAEQALFHNHDGADDVAGNEHDVGTSRAASFPAHRGADPATMEV